MRGSLPPLSWGHLIRLTDHSGIIQHCQGCVPDLATGYTTDDTARAIVAATGIRGLLTENNNNGADGAEEMDDLLARYLSWMRCAQKGDGTFHNFLSSTLQPLDDDGTQDAQGNAVWGLGIAACEAGKADQRVAARKLLRPALDRLHHLQSPRAMALSLLGFSHIISRRDAFASENTWSQETFDRVLTLSTRFGEQLCVLFRNSSSDDWQWYEPYLTYANARLPDAMIRAGKALGREDWIDIGLRSLEFLTRITMPGYMLEVIGNQGWLQRGQTKSLFDQQCVDAGAMVEAFLSAHDATGELENLDRSLVCLEWFHGRNILNVDLYVPATGACYDGITPGGVNANQGAESVLAYLMARISFDRISAHARDDVVAAV